MKNELPSTFKAFRFQQHRWSCGPANLFRKMALEIIRNEVCIFFVKCHDTISPLRRLHSYKHFAESFTVEEGICVLYSFFLVRKVIAHIVTFSFYCIILPATVLAPAVEVPKWGAVYIPTIITFLNAVGTPRFT